MEIKGPVPVVPAPVWRSFKELQEWEALHQQRPETGDKYSAAFESLTEGIHSFPGIRRDVGRGFLPELGPEVFRVARDLPGWRAAPSK